MNDGALQNAGWTVVRVWEHEGVQLAADRIEAAIAERVR
jgi:very-short-patch-repair endonuclease